MTDGKCNVSKEGEFYDFGPEQIITRSGKQVRAYIWPDAYTVYDDPDAEHDTLDLLWEEFGIAVQEFVDAHPVRGLRDIHGNLAYDIEYTGKNNHHISIHIQNGRVGGYIGDIDMYGWKQRRR